MLVYCFGVFGVFVNFFRYKILPLLLPSVSCWTDVTYYPQIKLHSPNAGNRAFMNRRFSILLSNVFVERTYWTLREV